MQTRPGQFIIVVIYSVMLLTGGCGGGGDDQVLNLTDTLLPSPRVLIDGLPVSDRLSYRWRQVAGPAAATMTDSTVASPEITFPVTGSYELMLEVSSQNQIDSDRLSVTVNRAATGPPGLTALPANTSQCVAPADAGTASSIRLSMPFPRLPFLDTLVGLYQVPGDNSVWYGLRQTGQIVRFANDPAVENVEYYVDISDRVDYGGEKGLLSMAFHPGFAGNGFVYLSYSALSAGGLESRISRFTLDSASLTLDPNSELVILRVNQPYSNHNGGQIAFGPDGMLYIGLGDGGSAGDPLGHGQNSMTLLGSMLRIDVGDGLGDYAIPPDNPYVSGGGAPEVFAYGLRNPWRWRFDRQTGDLWLGDVRQSACEEVDILGRGGNFGWNLMEGNHCYPATARCDSTGLITPVAEYGHSAGIAVTGGYVYRGDDLSFLSGDYLYGDYGSGKIWRLVGGGAGGYTADELLDTNLNISSFAQDQAGELYVLHLGGVSTRWYPAQWAIERRFPTAALSP
ncbi:MAG: PQQ-dependent sugar dehydrogenase [Candidatus Thiodiazotropha sp.]